MGTVIQTLITKTGVKSSGTVTLGTLREIGDRVVGNFTPSNSYAANGETIDLSALLPTQVYRVFIHQTNPAGVTTQPSKYVAAYVKGTTPANGKIKIIDSTSGSEVSPTTDLHTFNYHFEAYGV